MKITQLLVLLLLVSIGVKAQKVTSLKDAYSSKFLIGVALGTEIVDSQDQKIQNIIKGQFNSIVPENCMKSALIHPKEGVFEFYDADKLVKLGEENNMFIVGHTLVWHSRTPDWLFIDKNGNDVSREILIERMRKHIYTVVGRYKGRVNGWDVVNEAIDGADGWRNTKWLQIIGKEFIELAFQFAHEADPEAELYYNDYNMHFPEKREAAVRLIKRLQQKRITIHGIGMQAHYSLDTDMNEVEKSIKAYSQLGVKIMLTEIDISVLPKPFKRNTADVAARTAYKKKLNPYQDGLPDSVQQALAAKYESLFKILLKYEDVVSRATFWGLNDGTSWKNNFPVKGRTNYPLLFDRDNNPKPAYHAVINLVK